VSNTYQADLDTVKSYYVVRFGGEGCRRLKGCAGSVGARAAVWWPADSKKRVKRGSDPASPKSLPSPPLLQILPCILLAAIAHPYTSHWLPFRVSLLGAAPPAPCHF
jgi:hypothetical protein